MISLNSAIPVSCSSVRASLSPKLDDYSKSPISLKQITIFQNVPKTIKEASTKLLDAFVDSAFEFVDQPLLPSQTNFAPVEEIGEAVYVTDYVNGRIPDDFPVGVYIRNGPNPLFGALKSTKSIFGKSSSTWLEGEGMLHALCLSKDCDGRWMASYNNRYVNTDTLKLEKAGKKPTFLPALEGDSLAVLSAYLLNFLRFGIVNKFLSNTNVFEHAGKFFSITENHIPQEIDIFTLETRRNWDVNGTWSRPFTSHPKKDPVTGELVIFGVYPEKPYFELGIISADGNKLIHKVDIKLNRCCLCHEIGITKRYNVIMDFPLTIDLNRLIRGGPLMKYNKEEYARIGIMPRYGDADSIQWFEVEPSCTFHILNCYEKDDEVVVVACRALNSILPGPDFGLNKFEWFSKGFDWIGTIDENSQDKSFLSRVYEWRLNIQTGEASERNLTGTKYSMEFPIINEKYSGNKNLFGYTQVINSSASALSGIAKYGGLAKLYLEEKKLEISSVHHHLIVLLFPVLDFSSLSFSHTHTHLTVGKYVKQDGKQGEDLIKVEYHKFPEKTYCSGAAFVAKPGGEEDDGWIITYTHNEDNKTSQVHIVDAKNLSSEAVAIIDLPTRVPYGFHGSFMPLQYPSL